MKETDERRIHVTILGTGTSTGIPVIGCSCRVCQSSDPRDKRLRCSCFVEADGVDLLIDVGPDFRMQAMRAGISNIDAVLISHHHFDHVVGLDDLRPFLFREQSKIACYTNEESGRILRKMFGYIFDGRNYPGVPNLTIEEVEGTFSVKSRRDPSRSVAVIPVPAHHGDLEVLGFRIGRFAYITDTSGLPASSLELLGGLDVLVLDALRHKRHAKHLTIEQAVELAQGIGANETFFIHMTHSLLHVEENEALPDSMALAYDGQKFSVGF